MAIYKDRLKYMRAKREMTQEQISKAIGISVPAIQNYERGTRVPDLEFQIKIAEFFGVSLEYMRGETDNAKDSSSDELSTWSSPDPSIPGTTSPSKADKMMKLLLDASNLHDSGKLSDEEFQLLKDQILRG